MDPDHHREAGGRIRGEDVEGEAVLIHRLVGAAEEPFHQARYLQAPRAIGVGAARSSRQCLARLEPLGVGKGDALEDGDAVTVEADPAVRGAGLGSLH